MDAARPASLIDLARFVGPIFLFGPGKFICIIIAGLFGCHG